MHRRFFVPLGAFVFAAGQVPLLLFGVDSVTHSTLAAGAYATPVLAGVCAILAGFGVGVGPVSWRAFGAATYVLLAGSMLATVLVDVGTPGSLSTLLFGLPVALAVGLLLAMGIDVAFDTGRLLPVEPSTSSERR